MIAEEKWIEAAGGKNSNSGDKVEDNGVHAGNGDNWRNLVSLIQIIWDTGEIPQQMVWMVVVLLPKGGGNYRGIWLLEPFWKSIEVIMDK